MANKSWRKCIEVYWCGEKAFKIIRIVDYGVGNIQAFLNLLKRAGIEAKRATSIKELSDADKIILPGVGHFDHAMESLNKSGLLPSLSSLVLEKHVPILGICVGMQMLASESDEGALPGLGWIPGSVKSFKDNIASKNLPLPHMGWNNLEIKQYGSLFPQKSQLKPQFYFLHSYYFDAKNKTNVIATANYGFDFDVIVSNGNIHGIQCHPEKSHRWGEELLKNFAKS